MSGKFNFLRIEVDGHFHGSSEVPKPWVARIAGTDEKYGLAREFVQPMNDWRDARKAWSGNTYGVMATFALRSGEMYEVSRCRGKSSKRYVAREFVFVEDGVLSKREPLEALAFAMRHAGPAATLTVKERPEETMWVADVSRVGTPPKLGWVTVGSERHYLLTPGRIFEVRTGDETRFLTVRDDLSVSEISARAVLEWMLARVEAA